MATVQEQVTQSGKSKLWLCPDVVFNPKFNPNLYLGGYECSKSSIPKELREREVFKHFPDNGFECIIWRNDIEFEQNLNSMKTDCRIF